MPKNRTRLALGAVAVALALSFLGYEVARGQEAPGEGEPPTVEELLFSLVLETRGVRDAIGSGPRGQSDVGADVRAIREALKPGEIVVVALPAGAGGVPADAGTQRIALASYADQGYRLVAVSEGFAYLQK